MAYSVSLGVGAPDTIELSESIDLPGSIDLKDTHVVSWMLVKALTGGVAGILAGGIIVGVVADARVTAMSVIATLMACCLLGLGLGALAAVVTAGCRPRLTALAKPMSFEERLRNTAEAVSQLLTPMRPDRVKAEQDKVELLPLPQ